MKEAMTSTAASVLVQLLGAPAPSCTAPRMAAGRAFALGEPSHLFSRLPGFVRKKEGYKRLPHITIDLITGTCRSIHV